MLKQKAQEQPKLKIEAQQGKLRVGKKVKKASSFPGHFSIFSRILERFSAKKSLKREL
jgi:hypothetical protein